MSVDFLIAGQGLAGSLLAFELIQRGCRVLVVDNGGTNASQVAAGLINPVTGMRLVKTPHIEQLLPAAAALYRQLAGEFGRTFYHEKKLIRIFKNPGEKATFAKRLADPAYLPYLEETDSPGLLDGLVPTPHGFAVQKQTGYLSTRPLLEHLKQFLVERNAYIQNALAYPDIEFSPQLKWRDVQCRHIIFCEGHLSAGNPWFSWLPLQPAGGEILTLDFHARLPDYIVNKGHWLIPITPHQAKVGATYTPSPQPGQNGRTVLLRSLTAMLALQPARIATSESGIRPCTLDKQPFIGRHPEKKSLIIFNGFGSKGSLMIPWYCQRLAEHLLHQQALPEDCDIDRYAAKFPG